MSLTRQERRRRERQAYKEKRKNETYEMEIQILQPWSTPIMKTKLPPEVLQTMIEISDQVIADKDAKSWGGYLAGQINSELVVEQDILNQTGMMGFFLGAVRQYVIICKCQMFPDVMDDIKKEEWLTQMLSMWVVSQQPGEYNPAHLHTQCQISTVLYLKVPEMLPSRKEHRATDDGSILFFGNASRDIDLAVPQLVCPPKVGDFYIFGAHQQHAVYPYRCAEGQKDVERRSISFNAIFQSKTDYDKEKKLETPQTVVRPGETQST